MACTTCSYGWHIHFYNKSFDGRERSWERLALWKNDYAKQWYYKNREKQIQKNREWKAKNREKMLAQKMEYHYKNRDKILEHKKQYRLLHVEKIKAYRQRPEVKKKARERIKHKRIITNRVYEKAYYQKLKLEDPEGLREKWRRWHKNNPRSSPKYSLELQDAMNRVRIRDKNTCQWYGCGLKHKATQIHVHHIFPRKEYPELELVEQYMICYCVEHHAQFHAARGDLYSKLISPNYQEVVTK